MGKKSTEFFNRMIQTTLETFWTENVRGQEGYLGTNSMLRGLGQDGPRSSWRKHTLVIICGDLGIIRVAWSGIKTKKLLCGGYDGHRKRRYERESRSTDIGRKERRPKTKLSRLEAEID